MATALHVTVRLFHVVAMALLLGGATLIWLRAARASGPAEVAGLRSLAVEYEWVFWGAVGVVVATGVGNLGALAPGVPATGTAWGRTLAVKLGGLAALLVGSIVRTAMVEALAGTATDHAAHVRRRVRLSYAATALWLAALVVLGVVLAHG